MYSVDLDRLLDVMWCAQYPSIMILSHEYGMDYGVQGSLYTSKAEQDRTGQKLVNTLALFPLYGLQQCKEVI